MINESANNTPQSEPTFDLPAEMFRSGTKPEDATFEIENVALGGILYEPIQFTEVDGWAIYEGDIILGRADEVRNDPQPRGLVIKDDTYRWEDGVMPYVIGDESVRARVETAIQHWQEKTPIRFRVRTAADPDYVIFKGQGGCSSMIGRQGDGEQNIFLGSGCSAGSAIHEIGHALGLFHEQCRGDRDSFIKVVEANVDPNYKHNFAKHVTDASMVGGYDFGSIMHYPATAFSINGQPTIVAKDGQPIGQRNGLSKGDVEAIKLIYPHLDWSKLEAVADAGGASANGDEIAAANASPAGSGETVGGDV
ncbi:MAG: M12 family metallopeptidase [Pyrinomonadaceae bacterium]|nr:M12 family metallopeptidase [Pyrinomonadaceae bacterium]